MASEEEVSLAQVAQLVKKVKSLEKAGYGTLPVDPTREQQVAYEYQSMQLNSWNWHFKRAFELKKPVGELVCNVIEEEYEKFDMPRKKEMAEVRAQLETWILEEKAPEGRSYLYGVPADVYAWDICNKTMSEDEKYDDLMRIYKEAKYHKSFNDETYTPPNDTEEPRPIRPSSEETQKLRKDARDARRRRKLHPYASRK